MTEKEMIQSVKLPRIPIDGVIIDSLTTTATTTTTTTTTTRALGAFSSS